MVATAENVYRVTSGNAVQLADLAYWLSMDDEWAVDLTVCEYAGDEVWQVIVGAIKRGVAVTIRVRWGSQPCSRCERYALERLPNVTVEVEP
jgi:hypothetical protein